MVYTFRILSDEDKEFARELLISGDDTFLDFHHCLQENLGYDPMQLASFFITSAAWEKQVQITLIDMEDEEHADVVTMDAAKLSDYIKEPHQRLLYVFDFFSERSFFIELTDTLEVPEKKPAPQIVYAKGEAPVQIDFNMGVAGTGDDSFDEGSDEDDMFGDDMFGDMEFPDSDAYPDE